MNPEILTAGRSTFPHLRGVDGLRGAAVTAVVAYHLDRNGLRGGFLGVSLFFTLSGFLITWMLLREQATRSSISLGAFWERRARRLLPAALITLLVVTTAAATGVFDDAVKITNDAISSLAYFANWRQIATGSSYAGLFSLPSPLVHFWSLAIEEQFYLVYPLLAWAFLRRGRTAFAGVLIALTAVSVYSQLHFSYHFDRVYYGTDTRLSELTIGALLALVMTRTDGWLRIVPKPLRYIVPIAPLLTIAAWLRLSLGSDVFGRGGFAIVGVCSACTILWALTEPAILANPYMGWLGSRSYGIYLYHWPIVVLTEHQADGPARWWVMAMRLASTLLLAELSYRFIESPIRQRRIVLRFWWPRVIGAMATVAVLSLLVMGAAPRTELNSMLASSATDMPPIPLTPSVPGSAAATADGVPTQVAGISTVPAGPTTTTNAPTSTAANDTAATPPSPPAPPVPAQKILVVGDSTGAAAGAGLAMWGLTSGRAIVYDLAVNGCSLVRSVAHRPSPNFPPFVEDTSCNVGNRWQKGLAGFTPDKVVLITSISALYDFKVHANDDRWVSIADPIGREYIKRQYDDNLQVLRALLGPTTPIVIATTPYNFWPMCMNPCEIRDHARADALNAVFHELTHADGTVVTVDYADAVNRLNLTPKDRRRPDGLHFSKPASKALAEAYFGPALLAIPPANPAPPPTTTTAPPAPSTSEPPTTEPATSAPPG